LLTIAAYNHNLRGVNDILISHMVPIVVRLDNRFAFRFSSFICTFSSLLDRLNFFLSLNTFRLWFFTFPIGIFGSFLLLVLIAQLTSAFCFSFPQCRSINSFRYFIHLSSNWISIHNIVAFLFHVQRRSSLLILRVDT
jgi:hypothetical protein